MQPTNEYKEKNIKVAVFDKTSKEGKPYKSISIQKSNKGQDGVWKNETMYLFENEAKAVVNLLNQAVNSKNEALNSYDAPDDYDLPF